MNRPYIVGPTDRLDHATTDQLVNTASNLRFILRGSVPRTSRGRLANRLATIERHIAKRTGQA